MCPESTSASQQGIRGVPSALDRARRLAATPGRTMLGLAGPPGAGKSTLAAALSTELGPRVAVVAMDGFHLADAQLRRLGLADRKGTPETFDAHGFVALLRRVRAADHTVYAPFFDRTAERSLAGAVAVAADVPLVVVEGNYLLLDRPPWSDVPPLLDEVWWVDVDPATRRRRLLDRHTRHGRSATGAAEFVGRVDEADAALVAPGAARADLVVRTD